MEDNNYREGLLERLTQFIYYSAKDMNLPGSFREYYTGLVKEQVMGFIDEGTMLEPELLPQWIEAYARTSEAARKQPRQELFNELEAHATIVAGVFLAREYAILVDPGLVSVFKPKEEMQ